MNAYEEEVEGRVVKVRYKKGRRTDDLIVPNRHRRGKKPRERNESADSPTR